ncbi:MAG: hypothetical protein QW757_01495 [Candidatus Woesearchaeota archaeon]
MDDISNRTLALFLVLSIVVSLGATIYTLNKLNPGITGKVTQSGKVNLTVQNSISILLLNNLIDFGVGYVNTSCNEIHNNGKNFSNLTAGSSYIDNSDCWVADNIYQPTSFIIENNGNVNVSLKVAGPSPGAFFSGYTGVFEKNLTLIARNNEPNSCASGLYSWPTYNWVEFSENKTICNNLKYYPDSEDSIAIDVNVLIPVDLQSGVYENSSIEFFAQQV